LRTKNGQADMPMAAIYLAVSKSGAKRWVFLYEYKGKQREAGLGSVTRVTLGQARDMAVRRFQRASTRSRPKQARHMSPRSVRSPIS
jgi:hypothetical protein